MNNKYKLINSGEHITINYSKNKIKLNETGTYCEINKIENNKIFISDANSDFEAYILLFNQSALLWEQDKPCLSLHYDLSGNAIYKLPKYKALFFKVPKNACSTIVSEFYNRFYKKWYEPKCSTSQWIYRDIFPKINYRSEFEIIKQEYELIQDEYEDWKKFLIYDDPIKRFLRLLNHKYLQPDTTIASLVSPQENIGQYIDEMILLAQADNLNSRYHDTHLTSISNIWGDFLEEIDVFVNLKDLDKFLYNEFRINPRHYMVTKVQKPISQSDITEKQLIQIKKVFEKDYKIPEKFKENFYKLNSV